VKATATQVHGVLVVVQGIGLLLRGESGMGKSDCALELIRRGHRLVADDVVEIRADGDGQPPVGSAPAAIAGQLEVQDVGIVEVSSLFGTGALIPSHGVDAVIDLIAAVPGSHRRRHLDPSSPTDLLGHNVPTYVLHGTEVTTVANRLEVIARMLRTARSRPAGA
jgi:HPr kinase/phosphorylase